MLTIKKYLYKIKNGGEQKMKMIRMMQEECAKFNIAKKVENFVILPVYYSLNKRTIKQRKMKSASKNHIKELIGYRNCKVQV